jgi:hypothetical protein
MLAKSGQSLSFVVVVVVGLGFELRAFVLAKKVLYCLSHTCSPFCSSYFGGGVLRTICLGLALNLDPPDLSLPSS